MAALIEFLKTWGALALGAIGTALGIIGSVPVPGVRSELRARKEHRWKEEERQRADAKRAEAAAKLKWCQEAARQLDAGGSVIHVDESRMEWARWGDGTYFVLKTMPGSVPGTLLMRLRR